MVIVLLGNDNVVMDTIGWDMKDNSLHPSS